MVVRYPKNLAVLSNYRYPPRPLPAPNHRPRGSGQRSWTPGRAQHDRRGKAGSERRKACFHPGGSGFHLPRNARSASQFYSSSFHDHNAAFFDSFLVRPALLPYGKRGFRAAIYKIARPQPPAAALWLQERIVPFVSPVSFSRRPYSPAMRARLASMVRMQRRHTSRSASGTPAAICCMKDCCSACPS